jgi:hypothetical protein
MGESDVRPTTGWEHFLQLCMKLANFIAVSISRLSIFEIMQIPSGRFFKRRYTIKRYPKFANDITTVDSPPVLLIDIHFAGIRSA